MRGPTRFLFARSVAAKTRNGKIKAVSLNGSARESVEMYDWRGFSSLSHFDSRRRRRCGNVETRVLCGFPSSEGGQNRCGRGSIIPPSERHFHSDAPFYRPFCRECSVRAADGAEIAPFGKPRRMRIYPDSRSEPIK